MRFGSIERQPEFEAYWAGLKDRPAQRKVEAYVDDAIAKSMQK
jgi:glutathione S-transferase